MAQSDRLAELVNQSGFPLQIGVAAAVRRSTQLHGWTVLYSEHSWENPQDSSSGFLDLVLVDNFGANFISVECKRVLESAWVFLVSDPERMMERRHAKAWVTRYHHNFVTQVGWADVSLNPITPESSYCVIPGQDAKTRPLIERVGAELVRASEGMAAEVARVQAYRQDGVRLFFNMIVTTATLKVCVFADDAISLNDGKIHDARFREVPYLRFRKQLSARLPGAPSSSWPSPEELAYAKAQTLFVVNAEQLENFLHDFGVDAG